MSGAIAHATAVAAVGVLPSFLLGALVVQLRAELGLGPELLGLATAALFITAAIAARFGVLLVTRLGTTPAMIAAPAISATALLVGAAAPSFPALLVAMIVAGLGNAIAQPVANLRLAELVRRDRLGVAFGLKQAAVPSAALFAGLTVPAIAVSFGWRTVWVIAGILAVGIAAFGAMRRRRRAFPEAPEGRASPAPSRLGRGSMMLITFGAFFAASVGTSVGIFFVDSAVTTGFSASFAGMLYAAFSFVGIVTRVAIGWWSDQSPRLDSYRLAAALIASGAVGALLIVFGGSVGLIVGGLFAYVFGWAWPGLLHFAVARDNRAAVAAASGFLQSGSSLGAGVGPLLFGMMFGGVSFAAGWVTMAAAGVIAMTLLAVASGSVGRGR